MTMFDSDSRQLFEALLQKAKAEGLYEDLIPAALSASAATAGELPLGIASRQTTDGGVKFTVALITPPEGSADADAFEATAARLSCTKLLDRLSKGWVDKSADGRRSFVFDVAVPEDQASGFDLILSTLPALAALAPAGEEIAALRTVGTLAVTPTEGHSSIGQESKRALSPGELFGIGAVLDELSSTRPSSLFIHDVRSNPSDVNDVRDSFNRSQDVADMQSVMEADGWRINDVSPTAVDYSRGGEHGKLVISTKVLLISCEETFPTESTRALKAFDLLIGTERNGRPLSNPTETAQWLISEGHIRTETVVLSARGEKPIIARNQPTEDVIFEYTEAARNAKSKSSARQPFSFLKVNSAGVPEGIVSVSPSGRITNWTTTNFRAYLTAIAQYANVKPEPGPDGKPLVTEYLHGGPEALIGAIYNNLMEPGHLAPLEVVAKQPILVSHGAGHGQVISNPGYDAGAKAFVAIPARELGAWHNDYSVPARPTREQAIDAYKFVYTEVLADFPLVTARDRARAMAYILTCCGRNLTTGSPGFLFNAPTRGSGKSLLALVGRTLAQGTGIVQGFSFGDDRELRLNLLSATLDGKIFFHNDEVPQGSKMKSDALQKTITNIDGMSESSRVLGSQQQIAPSGLIATACGNNVERGSDLVRRFLAMLLQYQGGGPLAVDDSTRRHPDLLDWVLANRPRLLAAVHTILLHGLQNPAAKVPDIKMSHNWGRIILGALTHIPAEDGNGSVADTVMENWLEEINEEDENGEQWGELFCHLWHEAGARHVYAKTLARLIEMMSAERNRAGMKRPLLPEALRAFDPKGPKAGGTFAAAAKKMLGTPIPYEGDIYKLMIVRGSGTNTSKYYLERWNRNNELVTPPAGFPLEKLVETA